MERSAQCRSSIAQQQPVRRRRAGPAARAAPSNRRAWAVASSPRPRLRGAARPQAGQDAARARRGPPGASAPKHRGRGARQRAQRADQRGVGELALAELDAVAADHADAVRHGRTRSSSATQARLADARLPGDERDARPALERFRQPRPQLGELGGSSDERRAGHAGSHGYNSIPGGADGWGRGTHRASWIGRRGHGASGGWSECGPRSLPAATDPLRWCDGRSVRLLAVPGRPATRSRATPAGRIRSCAPTAATCTGRRPARSKAAATCWCAAARTARARTRSRPAAAPAPRVHEYGGGAYVVHGGTVFFSDFADQRLYGRRARRARGRSRPSPSPAGLRYADAAGSAGDRLVLRARAPPRRRPEHVNELVAVAADGSAAPAVVAEGHDFYAAPRVSARRPRSWPGWSGTTRACRGTAPSCYVAEFWRRLSLVRTAPRRRRAGRVDLPARLEPGRGPALGAPTAPAGGTCTARTAGRVHRRWTAEFGGPDGSSAQSPTRSSPTGASWLPGLQRRRRPPRRARGRPRCVDRGAAVHARSSVRAYGERRVAVVAASPTRRGRGRRRRGHRRARARCSAAGAVAADPRLRLGAARDRRSRPTAAATAHALFYPPHQPGLRRRPRASARR